MSTRTACSRKETVATASLSIPDRTGSDRQTKRFHTSTFRLGPAPVPVTSLHNKAHFNEELLYFQRDIKKKRKNLKSKGREKKMYMPLYAQRRAMNRVLGRLYPPPLSRRVDRRTSLLPIYTNPLMKIMSPPNAPEQGWT